MRAKRFDCVKTGGLAYYDTFAGLIPCRVLAVTGESGAASTSQMVCFRLTANKGVYRRGERLESSGLHVFPRTAVHQRAGQYVVWAYVVVADDCRD